MASAPSSDFPFWFPFAFVGMWLFVGGLTSYISGWTALATRFRATGQRPPGTRFRRQVVSMGFLSERGVTTLIPTTEGLYLYSHPLFRFRRVPLLVPWSAIRHAGSRGRRWWRVELLDLGGVTQVGITLRGYTALEPFLARAGQN